MTLYIAKNGQRLGPYSITEAQNLVRAGTIAATDLAWYQGITNWIPLTQVPGFASVSTFSNASPGLVSAPPFPNAGPGAPPSPMGRPVLVWVIFAYIILTTLSTLFTFFVILTSQSGSAHFLGTPQSFFNFGVMAMILLTKLTGGILLLMLRRAAFYCFAGTFVVGILMIGYNIVFHNWLHVLGVRSLAIVGTEWMIAIAILCYVWSLFKKGVLQ